MPDERKRSGAGVWAAAIIVGLILLPILYLLLLGPVYGLVVQGALTEHTWGMAVVPVQLWLERVGAKPDWFWNAYEFGYLMWWRALAEWTK